MKTLMLLCKSFIILSVFLILFACSRISQETFDQVKPGMTMTEVVAILGEPTSTDSINIAGVSGTSAVWKSSQGEISMQFLNDKLMAKSFTKSGDTSRQ